MPGDAVGSLLDDGARADRCRADGGAIQFLPESLPFLHGECFKGRNPMSLVGFRECVARVSLSWFLYLLSLANLERRLRSGPRINERAPIRGFTEMASAAWWL